VDLVVLPDLFLRPVIKGNATVVPGHDSCLERLGTAPRFDVVIPMRGKDKIPTGTGITPDARQDVVQPATPGEPYPLSGKEYPPLPTRLRTAACTSLWRAYCRESQM
jgi:hypothetical protein